MNDKLKNLFQSIKQQEIPAGLEGKILRKMSIEKAWQKKKRLIFADALVLGSLGAFVFVVTNFWSGIAKSEFWSLAKLAFSDTSAVLSFWKDFLFSLLETFPAGHLAAVLAPVFLLLVSASLYFSSAGNNNHMKKIA